MPPHAQEPTCRSRLAPSPTGLLHLGHARTFWVAAERMKRRGGTLLLRNDDLDRARCRPEFVEAMRDDLRWLGIDWQEPMISQSERLERYGEALKILYAGGWIFPCNRSRRDVAEAVGAPHEGGEHDEPVYPKEWRPAPDAAEAPLTFPSKTNWRFRVPDGETLVFDDVSLGRQSATAGVDFGDFLVWRKDDVPSYQLASAVDDADFAITEIVRGADLVKSTFRQMLVWRALGVAMPRVLHCPLMTDDAGVRLAKRHDALSLRTLRESGVTAQVLREKFSQELSSLVDA